MGIVHKKVKTPFCKSQRAASHVSMLTVPNIAKIRSAPEAISIKLVKDLMNITPLIIR